MNYKLFTNLKVIQSILFLFIPLFLWLIVGERLNSLSDYAYSAPMFFALSLTLAGALFFYDGFVDPGRWFNMVLGVCLFGAVLTPNQDAPVLHYIFAGLFFVGSVFNMVYFSNSKERVFNILTGVFVVLGMFGHYFFNFYSLFWAEWLGMVPISGHYIFEALNKTK